MQKKQSLRGNIILLIGAIGVAIILMEILFRLANISYPYFTYFTIPDAATGYRLRPNAEGWQRSEGEVYLSINSMGLRDEEHLKKKAKNTIRIALLGDSFAEARHVSLEKTFWNVAEKKLRSCYATRDREVEFVNFGVSGYGTAQELLMLRSFVWEYSPDVVLLATFIGNDLADNVRALSGNSYQPYFTESGGTLFFDKSFQNTKWYSFRTSSIGSGLLTLLTRSRTLQVINRGRLFLIQKKRDTDPKNVGLYSVVYTKPKSAEWKRAWNITERLISTMAKETKAHGSRFAVVMTTNGGSVHPDPDVRERFKKELAVPNLFYPEKRIGALGKQQGFPVLALAPLLQKRATRQQIFFHGFLNTQFGAGHWNEDGHRAAGEILAQTLCEKFNRWAL